MRYVGGRRPRGRGVSGALPARHAALIFVHLADGGACASIAFYWCIAAHRGAPLIVSPLAGRLFFCWTVITGSLCLTTAFNFGSTCTPRMALLLGSVRPTWPSLTLPHAALRRLTLFSFLFAFAHFMSEVYLFKTLTLPDTYSTIAVSGAPPWPRDPSRHSRARHTAGGCGQACASCYWRPSS